MGDPGDNPNALVVRTAWLYGEHGPNFVTTMLPLAGEREVLQVVDDQIGQPTWTRDLAAYVVDLVEAGERGGYHHGTALGQTTSRGSAREIFQLAGLDRERVKPCTEEFPRPPYSVLADRQHEAAIGPWADRLASRFHRLSVSMAVLRAEKCS